MDDETLAPMADALSATLAVIVLLICFFILAQVVAISKQIDLLTVGDSKYIKYSLDLNFKKLEVKDGRLNYFKSFNPEENSELILSYLNEAKEQCKEKCTGYKIISNYPVANVSKTRSQRRALSNAIKMVPILIKNRMDYEIELSNSSNFHFIKVVPIMN